MPTEVGVPMGSPVSAMIGAAGGMLATSDARFTVVIPPGALAADTMISIQPITNTANGGRGDGYALLPDGQTFAQPVELRWQPTADDLEGSAIELAHIDRQDADGYWEQLDVTRDAGVVTASTPHFSHYSPSIVLFIVPNRTDVAVEEFRAFQVWFCANGVRVPGTRSTYTSRCDQWQSATAARSLGDWSVDGIVGGNATVGTATYTGPGSMSFEAPEQVPADNPVSVSVPVRDYLDQPVSPLVSHVHITGRGHPYDGTVTWDQGDFDGGNGSRQTATVHFSDARPRDSYTSYEVTGAVTIEIRSPDCMPKTITLSISANTALGDLTVWTSGLYAMTYSFTLNTDITDTDLSCSGSGGPFTRTVSITGSLDCHEMPYTDVGALSAMMESARCSVGHDVDVSLVQQ